MNLTKLTDAQKTAVNMALENGEFTHDKGRYNMHIFKRITKALIAKNILKEDGTLTDEARAQLTPEEQPKRSKRNTKLEQLKNMLNRAEGANVAEISANLGWQGHTIRAAISRLRKDTDVETFKDSENKTFYRLASFAD